MRMVLKQIRLIVPLVGLLAVIMGGCAQYPPLSDGTIKVTGIRDNAVIDREEVTIPIQEVAEVPQEEYLIGPTDLLLINAVPNATAVSLQVTAQAGPQAGMQAPPQAAGQVFRVDSAGFVTVPLGGRLKVAGLTVAQVQEQLNEKLKKYVKEPAAIVEVNKPSSQPLYLIGAFKLPGIQYLDRPTTLIQGLALGGGPDTQFANLRSARLVRDKRIVPVDIYETLMKGDLRYNIWLKGGDTVYIPDRSSTNVFVYGAVSKPGPIPVGNSLMTLPQALASAGFGDLSYDPNIRIIRSLSTTRGELLVVNHDRLMRGESVPFMLMEGDVIFVPRGPIGNWNHALQEILPSLQTVSGLLQPFVQIKYLTRGN